MSLLRSACCIFLFVFTLELHAQSFDECLSQAQEPLEISYCEVKKLSRNEALPSLEQFKKNPPETQRLILKRDAEYYGVDLPKTNKAAKPPQSSLRVTKQSNSLTGCEFHGAHIECGTSRFELVHNLKNNQLSAQAFSAENTLRFPDKNQGEFENMSDFRYLSSIYPLYIHKMLEIGLGDSTMSFTKFATLYWQSKKDEQDFARRFEKIYNLLKIEKSRNQVRERYSEALPEALDKCMRMDNKIILCDNAKQNWVYKLK